MSGIKATSGRAVRRAGGFTLVEVLVSLVLVGLIMPAAMEGISVAVGVASLAKHRTEAVGLADGLLAEMLATGEWQTGDLSGDFSPDKPQYRWKLEVLDWEETTLRQLDLTVSWDARGQERYVILSTLAYMPEST
jgi:general secretion pathway protein I